MPRQLALFIYILIVIYLFWIDRKNNEGISKAIWIPFLWMFPSATQEYSFWLSYLFGIGSSSENLIEGNAYDRLIQIVLMAAAAYILVKRKVNWNTILWENIWIWLYFLFGLLSCLWSDYPFVSFKRLIKAIGNVMILLVILSENLPYETLFVIVKRIAFLVIPLSVLSIKYYPSLGRRYNYQGIPMLRGICRTKNTLGQICLIVGTFFCWKLVIDRWKGMKHPLDPPFSAYLIIFSMTAWLFYMADSATSLTCMFLAVGIFMVARLPTVSINPPRIIFIVFGIFILYGIMESLFNLTDTIIVMLGRRPDLTTRVPMWDDLLGMVKNPIIGFGYESFWLGDRREFMVEEWGIASQAHNGYLEMYLNMGLIGVLFLATWLISGLKKIMQYIAIDYPNGVLRFCLFVIIAVYNWTEATFYGNTNMWLLFFFAIMDPLNDTKPNTQTLSEHDIKPIS